MLNQKQMFNSKIMIKRHKPIAFAFEINSWQFPDNFGIIQLDQCYLNADGRKLHEILEVLVTSEFKGSYTQGRIRIKIRGGWDEITDSRSSSYVSRALLTKLVIDIPIAFKPQPQILKQTNFLIQPIWFKRLSLKWLEPDVIKIESEQPAMPFINYSRLSAWNIHRK